jgi:hypothetical protein
MPNHTIRISSDDRTDTLKYIQDKKKEGTFRVIDVGGSMGGWSAPVLDALVDFNDHCSNPNILHFKSDITHPDGWKDILEYVHTNGKFDFCICTHTLEDIINPKFVTEQLSKIAKSGYIAFPSKYRELSRFESGPSSYRGYIHHRWIFDMKGTLCVAYPKINYLDSSPIFDSVANISTAVRDLSFYWDESIEMEYLNTNYLGPTVWHVKNYYTALLDKH